MTFAALARFLPPLLLPALALAACGGGGGDEPRPVSGEMRDLLEEVAEMRGLEPPTGLRVATVSPEDAAEFYTGLIDPEHREALQQGGALYRLLGYIEPDETYWDVTLATAELAAGFYSYEHKTLWIVTEQDGTDIEAFSEDERSILVHEMIHAIQDHHFNLGETEGRVEATIDAGLAWTSLIEGDATLHTDIWGGRLALIPGGFPGGGLVLLAALWQADGLPPEIERAFWFPYLTGPVALQRLLAREGAEALDALFERPPPGTAAYIHTHLLGTDWAPEEGADRLLPADAIAASLGPGWAEEESGVLGEFHLMNYLLGDTSGYPWPAYGYEDRYYSDDEFRVERAGEGWRGDHYRLFANGEERVLVVAVRFADAENAREFAEAHRESIEEGAISLNGHTITRVPPVGRDVLFAIGTSEEATWAALEAALAPLVGG